MIPCTIKATVLRENGLWVTLFERTDKAGYAAAREIFGGEPTDAELYAFISEHFYRLNFTAPQNFQLVTKRKNPKRLQREVRQSMAKIQAGAPPATFAQEVLRVAREAHKKTKQIISRDEREQQQAQKFLLRQAKRKKKQKGH